MKRHSRNGNPAGPWESQRRLPGMCTPLYISSIFHSKMDASQPCLKETLQFSYPPNMTQDGRFNQLQPLDTLLAFYDRHIDSQLSCKHVAEFPIGPVLSRICDEAIADFCRKGHKFLPEEYGGPLQVHPTVLGYSESVGSLYSNRIGFCAHTLASKIQLNPANTSWRSFSSLTPNYDYELNSFVSETTLQIIHNDPDRRKEYSELSDATVRRIKGLQKQFEHIAIWHFYPMTPAGKMILKQMQPQQKHFPWQTSRTSGYTISSKNSMPRDADPSILHRGNI